MTINVFLHFSTSYILGSIKKRLTSKFSFNYLCSIFWWSSWKMNTIKDRTLRSDSILLLQAPRTPSPALPRMKFLVNNHLHRNICIIIAIIDKSWLASSSFSGLNVMVKLSDQIGRVLLVTYVLITNPFFALLGDYMLTEKILFDILYMMLTHSWICC